LGFEGEQWPIYMADEASEKDGILKVGEGNFYVKNISEIKMNVGDCVIYKGCEKYHWRDEFKGKWQVQVFLHYVDKNGINSEWKYDKRQELGTEKNQHPADKNLIDVAYIFPNIVSDAFCDKLIEEYASPKVEKIQAGVGGFDNQDVDLNIRNVKKVQLPVNQGIGATLTAIGLNFNHEKYKFNITHSNQAEFLMYDINGKYEAHVDTFPQMSDETRKLTVIAILNDDFEGGKFYIKNSDEKIYPKQNKGDVIIFPSFMVHGVEPVTKGIRYSVVTWLVGEYFK
jgi:PKHD-type hydroxylase